MARRRRRRSQSESKSGWRPSALLIATVLIGAGIVIVVLLAFSILVESTPESAAAQQSVSERYQVPGEGAAHVNLGTDIAFDHYPPSSGPHYGTPSRYGVFDETVPEGAWLHNLEHGAVVLLYKCGDDCESAVNQMRDLYRSLPDGVFGEVKFIAAPYDRAPTDFTLLAWGWQEDLTEFDAGRVERFYRDLVDKGPENAR